MKEGKVDVAKAAELLGITRQGVWHRIRTGRYSSEKIREGKREWVEIPFSDIQADLPDPAPLEPAGKPLEGRIEVFTELVELVKDSRYSMMHVLERQVDVKDQQIENMEHRLQRLEAELEKARVELEASRERVPWWRRWFG